MEKRGELSSAQIVTIVLAIAGFIIIFIFASAFFRDRGEVDMKLCELSVLTRATSPVASLQASVPLKCTTQKICISESGKKDACPEFLGEENVKHVELKGNDEEKSRIIEKETAEAMLTCWLTMGEGKLNVFEGSERSAVAGAVFTDLLAVKSSKKVSCVVCSRLAISSDVSEEVRNRVDVNRYAEESETYPGSGITFLEAFAGDEVKQYPQSFLQNISVNSSGTEFANSTRTNQLAFVFMQILAPENSWESALGATSRTFMWAGGAMLTSGGRVLANPFGIAATTTTAVTLGTISGINAYESRQIAGGACGKLTGEGNTSSGCSLVVPLEYNVNSINSLCQIIEGQP